MQSIDMLVDATREFLHQTAAFLPKLLLALVVVAVGWLLAKAVRFAVERALRAINFNVLTERAGTDNFLRQAGMRGDTTTLFGLVAYWLVILAALIIAFNGNGLDLPAGSVGAGGAVHAEAAHRHADHGLRLVLRGCRGQRGAELLPRRADRRRRHVWAGSCAIAIMLFVVMIALSQVEVGGDIVQRTFLIILAGLMLAIAPGVRSGRQGMGGIVAAALVAATSQG